MNQIQWIEQFNEPNREGWLEIAILATLIYTLFRFFQGTRGSSILTGLLVLFGALYAITSIINLDVLNWLLSRLTLYFSLALIIIFQPEIRRALARLGRQPWRKKRACHPKKPRRPPHPSSQSPLRTKNWSPHRY